MRDVVERPMRAVLVNWLVASVCASSFLAIVVMYLALAGYFEAPGLGEMTLDRGELIAILVFFVASHVISRRGSRPRCVSMRRTFAGVFHSYRVAPEVVVTCGDPSACARRSRNRLDRRVALGVALSLPIGIIAVRSLQSRYGIGGDGCHSTPLDEGGNILLCAVLAAVAILSHIPGWRVRAHG